MSNLDLSMMNNEVQQPPTSSKMDARRARNREHARLSRERKRKQMAILEEENESIRRDLDEIQNQRSHLALLLEQSEAENKRLRAWIDTYYVTPYSQQQQQHHFEEKGGDQVGELPQGKADVVQQHYDIDEEYHHDERQNIMFYQQHSRRQQEIQINQTSPADGNLTNHFLLGQANNMNHIPQQEYLQQKNQKDTKTQQKQQAPITAA
uniref:BZIP domain-containing protein n=1 Tax=Aureoumbra lagunensis TaxID=44058 RepID=A0A7S3JMZ0_9STRA|mmetsp:Transcript_4262/g.6021  ORF Transcript_4262/g.6021 Transcript_4262/m.6021 type:complete len:208 (+) Transcript_4262:48-671(+)